MINTPRLALPCLSAAQAQKEFLHNEALLALDTLVGLAIDGFNQDTPPATPTDGACYIVGPSPTGAFAGKSGQVASYSEAGWRFAIPVEGLTAMLKADGRTAVYRASGWETGIVRADSVAIAGSQVLSTRAGAIASLSGGSIVDTQARSAIDAILSALRHHGLIA